MGMIITLIVVFILTVVLTMLNFGVFDFEDFLVSGLLGFLFGLLTTLLATIILIGIAYLPNNEYNLVETVKITAMKDNSRTSGSFYLFGGTVSETDYYYYMTETGKGLKRDKVDVEHSTINEVAENPKVEIYKSQYTNAFIRWYFGETSPRDAKYVFYVPPGTVTTQFEVDME